MSGRSSLILALIAVAVAAVLPAGAGAQVISRAAVIGPPAGGGPGGAASDGHLSAPSGLRPNPRNRRPSTDRRLSPAGRGTSSGAARPFAAPAPAPAAALRPGPALVRSFDGINHRDQVLANGGSDFSTAEPPDQGLCVGHGFVTEAVNVAVRFYTTAGTPLGPTRDLNSFFGYPPEISDTGAIGPFITDPSCLYDPVTQRWFLTVLTAELDPDTGGFTGPNHIDIAVSRTSDPTKSWTVYRLPVQDDGTQGTPNHHCTNAGPGTGDGPCLGDYPHIGSDAAGFYVTTNEYSLGGPDFHGAQIYALSKAALVAGAATVPIVALDTHGLDAGNSGFTLAPATSPDGRGDPAAGGTEYFLSSNAGDEAHGDGTAGGPRASDQLLVWALTNTGSLDAGPPALSLSHTVVNVRPYSVPPLADQKAGPVPLADCLGDPTCATILNGEPDPFAPEAEAALDSNDTRMQQVSFAAGRLWGALDTALSLGGQTKAGIEWFVVKPTATPAAVSATVENQGYTGLPGENLTYPAIGMTAGATGVMAFTVTGPDYYPSAGYAAVSADGVGPVELAKRGAGPSDGLSDYKYYGQPAGTARPRWGDYGAAAVDGKSVWIASEYIGQTCDLAAFESSNGTCGDTRTPLANWDTRISQLIPPAGCDQTLGSTAASVTLRAPGSYCLRGATIAGSLTALPGVSLHVTGSTIRGGILSTGSSGFTLCDSTIGAGLTVRGATGYVLAGDGGDDGTPGCGPNTVAGAVDLNSNQAGVELAGNRIGAAANVSGNRGGPGPPTQDGSAVEIEGNRITAGLTCRANTPPATNDGQPNTVGAANTCGL